MKKKDKKLNIQPFKSNKFKRIFSTLMISLVILTLIGIMFFMISNKFSNKVYNNIFLEGEDLSKYSADKLDEKLNELRTNYEKDTKVILRQDGKEIDSVIPEDVEFEIDVAKTKKAVYNYGRDENIFMNTLKIFLLNFKEKNFNIEYKINGEKLNEKILMIEECLTNKVINDSYELDENNFQLIISKGKKGVTLNKEVTKNQILENLKKGKISELDLNVEMVDPVALNVDEIYDEVYRKPVNAEIRKEDEKTVFVKEIYGLDFDKEKLKEKISENTLEMTTFKYNLDVSAPLTKFEDISWSSYDDVLGSVTTYFEPTQKNKGTNISVALKYLDGKVIMPDETFSYNNTVGEVTADKGYVEGGTYLGTSIVNGIGGGICQTVSTLYDAILYSNLEVVSRTQHTMPVTYVRASLDATMYYPSIDFKFKNNRNFPIKIKTTFSWTGSINISILGTKEDTDVEVELETKQIEQEPYTIKTVIDNTLEPGKQYVKQNGLDGYTSEAYKITKKDGKIIERKLISRDKYKPIQKIVVEGPNEDINAGE